MKNWIKERRTLNRILKTKGLKIAYHFIPKEMPIEKWPRKLQEYHEQRLLEEVTPDSPAELARQVRIDEIHRSSGKTFKFNGSAPNSQDIIKIYEGNR